MTEKLKLHTPNITDENVTKIAALFPHCVSEGKIDFELLKQELSNSIIDGTQERYQLNWVGKREALLTANAPIAKTLRPCREESVNFDTTENLYIEGDNLDALKLLQETYLGKIKMIYIDPPYNTGNDFIYNDNFAENTADYLQRSNQRDDDNCRLTANPESNGRFHSDWLSMMYPRLRLARNLLRDDGVIFISIDEAELGNTLRILDEVFGEKNAIATFVWQNKKGGGNDAKYCAIEHEYVILFAKNVVYLSRLFESFSDEYAKRYKEEDSEGRYFWDTFKRKSGKQYYAITCPDGQVLSKDEFGNPLSWLRSENRFKEDLEAGEIKFEKKADESWSVMFKQRMPEGKKPRSLILDKGTTGDGSDELLNIFNKNIFSNPKPVSLVNHLSGIILKENDIILDFFSGSATTAHAVMQLNAEDGGKRKFIMVQIPEACDEKSEAFKAGYKTIADIGKERIRRAGQKIKTDNALTATDLDIGFRVLKVDSSNMNEVYYSPDAINKDDLHLFINNIKDDRSDEDLLFQVLLDWGVDLTLPIERQTIDGKTVFVVAVDAIVACFDRAEGVSESFIKELAKIKPLRAVFCDGGFANDSVKINVEQIFKTISPMTEIKTI